MSTSPPKPGPNTPTLDEPLPNLLFEYRDADIVLRSRDSHHFRVPKSYIVNSSPVLEEVIRKALDTPDDMHWQQHCETLLPVVPFPESGAALHSLLTFIFPVTIWLPLSTERAMELLSVAQKYQMASVLDHIRGRIARQNPPSTDRDSALHTYSLAQKYGLHQEALQAAQAILKYPMNIGDLEDKLDMMPGASLYELWKYYEKVRSILASDLPEFRTSGARGTLTGLNCVELSSSQIPRWIDDYIASIGDAPNLFDHIEFNVALARHIGDEARSQRCACVSLPSQTIRNFWNALASVVHSSLEEADSALSLVQERDHSQTQVNLTTSPLEHEPMDVPDADLIIRSSDLVKFRVHKAVLTMASPFFGDLLSLPQPSDSESVDGLPVVQLFENAELLNCLISMLYPVPPVIPRSYDKVLYLLAACQKYDMIQVLSSIRAEVSRGNFLAPAGTEVFRAYAIASSKGLALEVENAARLTLDHPMTFETLGEGLRFFDGWALRDLARFRKRRRDNLLTCLESLLHAKGSSNIWAGCPNSQRIEVPGGGYKTHPLPSWLYQVLSRNINDLKLKVFTHPLTTPSIIRGEYVTAIQAHVGCHVCSRVCMTNGLTYWAELESKLTLARDKVRGDHG